MNQAPLLKATKVTALALTTASLIGGAMAQQMSLPNGGFENGPLPAFSKDSRFAKQATYFYPNWETENVELPGWGVVEADPLDPKRGDDPSNIALINDLDNAFNNPEGSNFLYIGGPTCLVFSHSVSSTGTWTPGKYQVTFKAATWSLDDGALGDSRVSIEGRYAKVGDEGNYEDNFEFEQIAIDGDKSKGANDLIWKTYTVDFTVDPYGKKKSHKGFDLLITNQSGVENEGLLLDGFSIAAVPEPSSSLLLLGGLGGMILRRRR